jgi:hypothetical protein
MITLFSLAWATTIVDVPGPTAQSVHGDATLRIRRAAGDLLVFEGYPRSVVASGPHSPELVLWTASDPAFAGADVDGDGDEEVVVVLQTGDLFVYDSTTFDLRFQQTVASDFVQGLVAGDLDGDGADELVISTLRNWRADYVAGWDLSGGVATEVWSVRADTSEPPVVAQVDADAPREVVVGPWVHDGLTGAASRLPTQLSADAVPRAAGDVDGDGLDDLLFWDPTTRWTMWSTRRDLVWWTHAASMGSGHAMADVTGNGRQDVFLQPSGTGQVLWLRGTTGTVRGSVPLSEGPFCCGSGLLYAPGWASGPRLRLGSYDIGATGVDPAALPAFSGWPVRADLDGDGVHELVFFGPELTVTDAQGQRLTADPVQDALFADLADHDGDGVVELVSTDDGVALGWQWDRTRGFHAPVPLLPSTGQSLYRPKLVDLDGDGVLDLAYSTGNQISVVDGASGALRPDLVGIQGRWEVADFDGDGASEIVSYETVTPSVFVQDGAGTRLDSVRGEHSQVLDTPNGPRVVVTDDGTVVLYALVQGAFVAEDVLVPPHRADRYWYVAGRVWFEFGDTVHAWSPATDETWRFDLPDLTDAPVVLGGSVWLSYDAVDLTRTQRWDLP